ncbi:DUF6090 family protein [Eudoraea sp.]|uniref:DUF6090 family protein n=1 Tax=Eudoraea sp. TaxID=1979955 RepID=UPI003C797074
MINFFRKIRYRLAKNNQFFKYSRYAIGEIVLVVIGILIALQINSWNADRINNQEERRYLIRLTDEVRSELNYLKDLRDIFFDRSKGLNRIIEQWQSGNSVVEDTAQYLQDYSYGSGLDPWYREPITWTQLQQSGDLNLLKNKNLTDDLFVFYSEVNKLGDNFVLNPMKEFVNTREKLNVPLINDGGVIIIFKYVGALYVKKEKIQINKEIFNKIWNYREELLPSFVRVSGICQFQVVKLQEVIETGEVLLKKLEKSLINN